MIPGREKKPTQKALPSRLILFDGVCHLCNNSVQFIIHHDSAAAFTFATLQSQSAQDILRENGFATDDFDSFVYMRDSKAYLRSTAALKVLKDLGGLWQMLYVFIIVPNFIRDWFYDRVAKSRYSIWGKKESCMIPTPELESRFLY